jgi:hypothetical protein
MGYILNMYKYGTLKPVQVTLRRRVGEKENNGGREMSQTKIL